MNKDDNVQTQIKPNIIKWTLERYRPITEQDAITTQNKMGYDVRGYGFYNFTTKKTEYTEGGEHKYLATWTSFSSCD